MYLTLDTIMPLSAPIQTKLSQIKCNEGNLYVAPCASINISNLNIATIKETQQLLSKRTDLKKGANQLVETWYHIYSIQFDGKQIVSRGIRNATVERIVGTVEPFEEFGMFVNLREKNYLSPEPLGVYISNSIEKRLFVEYLEVINPWAEFNRLYDTGNESAAYILLEKFEQLRTIMKTDGFKVGMDMRLEQVGLEPTYLLSDDPKEMFWILDAESLILTNQN